MLSSICVLAMILTVKLNETHCTGKLEKNAFIRDRNNFNVLNCSIKTKWKQPSKMCHNMHEQEKIRQNFNKK